MKIFIKICLAILLVFVLGILAVFSMAGYVPGLSRLVGAEKPRDLGVRYTTEDFKAARAKSQIEYEALPADTPAENSLQRTGSRPITTNWSSSEMTSLMNDRPWKYWPIKNVQLKISNDGLAELSGVLITERLAGYSAAIGLPSAISSKTYLLPKQPAFYVKARTSLTENKVSDFDIQEIVLGKIPIPVNSVLGELPKSLIETAYAESLTGELSQYSGKKAAITDFINNRLSQITGFFAKKAYFKDGELFFDGTLSEKELTVR